MYIRKSEKLQFLNVISVSETLFRCITHQVPLEYVNEPTPMSSAFIFSRTGYLLACCSECRNVRIARNGVGISYVLGSINYFLTRYACRSCRVAVS